MIPFIKRGDDKIYTVTFTPALDYYVRCDDFTSGDMNRAQNEVIHAGGKGINVSAMLKNLGIRSVAMGCIGGFTGEALNSMIKSYGVSTDFIKVEGTSRINVKLMSNGVESELNGQGPIISEASMYKIVAKLKRLEEGSTVVFAGILPSCMPHDTYKNIMEELKDRNLNIVLDTSGEPLLSALIYKPFLIKPNRNELGELFNTEIKDVDDVVFYARKLREMGARNVIVSLGADGACMLTENGGEYYLAAPCGKLVSSVGAGDSLVAGFLAGLNFYGDFLTAFRLGVAAGSATAFTEWIADGEKVMSLFKSLENSVATLRMPDDEAPPEGDAIPPESDVTF